MTVDDLRQQIEETERLIAVYRNADEVIVGTSARPLIRIAALYASYKSNNRYAIAHARSPVGKVV